jgi:hypothetical protein
MTRAFLFPVLLLSSIAFAADPAPAAPAAPAAPTAPATAPAKPAAPVTPGAPAATPAAPGKAIPLAVFKDVDKNNDKALDKTELAHIADLIRDFNIVDTDKNGKLNEAEYTAWVEKQKQM